MKNEIDRAGSRLSDPSQPSLLYAKTLYVFSIYFISNKGKQILLTKDKRIPHVLDLQPKKGTDELDEDRKPQDE